VTKVIKVPESHLEVISSPLRESQPTALSQLKYAEPTELYLRDGEVVIHRRPGSPLWHCRFRLQDGSWHRQTSPKHMDGLDVRAQKLTSKTTDQRMKMGILTSRALKKSKQICEQAARGKFPNSSPIDLPEFDWDEIYKKIVKARLTKK
jgi:hypothetical protein